MLLLPRLIGGYSGVMVEKFGYHNFFLITACWACRRCC
jgi:PAT family beta-lactamase induction signal transducer AmpG